MDGWYLTRDREPEIEKMGQYNQTGDLFAEVALDPVKTDRRKVRPAHPSTKQKPRAAAVDHMAAAKRLHWKLRRAPSHSPEEVKAGRLICRHLLAMLDEAELHAVPQNDSVYALSRADNS